MRGLDTGSRVCSCTRLLILSGKRFLFFTRAGKYYVLVKCLTIFLLNAEQFHEIINKYGFGIIPLLT